MVKQLTGNPCEKLIDISLDYADAGKRGGATGEFKLTRW
jgi:hypothetical protein